MPAPENNTNAQKHGLVTSRRAAAAGFRTRRLPKGFRYIANEAGQYATALHATVEQAMGDVSRNHLELIQAAAAWHQHGLYVLRTLRINHDELKPEQRVQLSAEVAKAVQRRVDQVLSLGIPDDGPLDPFNGTLDPATAAAINGEGGQ